MEVGILIVAVLFVALIMVVGSKRYRCQKCRKTVAKDATVCPYCGNDFTQKAAPPPAA